MIVISAIKILDTSGLSYPLPVLKAKQVINNLSTRDVLWISTEQVGPREIPLHSKITRQELVEEYEEDSKFIFIV